jgi:hypothetical protein
MLMVATVMTSCRTQAPVKKESLPIMVQGLECTDPVLGKMMTLCVIERFGQRRQTATSMNEEAQTRIVIKGIVYRKDVSTTGSNSTAGLSLTPSAGFGVSQTTANGFTGSIVEGVSLVALLDGKEIGSATYFQTPQKGIYQSPQVLVQNVTDRIYVILVQKRLIFKR